MLKDLQHEKIIKVKRLLPYPCIVRFIDENNQTLSVVTQFEDGDINITTYKKGAVIRVSPDSVIMNCKKMTRIKASEI